jgi:hypothetical protein
MFFLVNGHGTPPLMKVRDNGTIPGKKQTSLFNIDQSVANLCRYLFFMRQERKPPEQNQR